MAAVARASFKATAAPKAVRAKATMAAPVVRTHTRARAVCPNPQSARARPTRGFEMHTNPAFACVLGMPFADRHANVAVCCGLGILSARARGGVGACAGVRAGVREWGGVWPDAPTAGGARGSDGRGRTLVTGQRMAPLLPGNCTHTYLSGSGGYGPTTVPIWP